MAQNFIFINKNSLLHFHATQRLVLARLHKQRRPNKHHPSNSELETENIIDAIVLAGSHYRRAKITQDQRFQR